LKKLIPILIATPAVIAAIGLTVTPVRSAARPGVPGSFSDAVIQGDVEEAYAFVRAGLDPNAMLAFRHQELTADRSVSVSPLLLATATHRDNIVSMLLSFGARMDLPQNRLAICLAKQSGDDNILRILGKGDPDVLAVECPPPRPGLAAPLLEFAR
jgi:hypothetical protein